MWELIKAFFLLLIFFFTPQFAEAALFSPTSQDLFLQPGETGMAQVEILNTEETHLQFQIDAMAFSFDDISSNIVFSPLPKEVSNWLSVSQNDFLVAPDDYKDISVQVVVPEDAKEGIYQIGLQVLSRPLEENDFSLTTGFTSLLFVTVGNDFNNSSELLIEVDDQDFTTFIPVTSFPEAASLTVKNEGERILQPSGELILTDIFGMHLSTNILNQGMYRTLPGQQRVYDFRLEGGGENFVSFVTGLYKVELKMKSWSGGDERIEEATVFVWPRPLLVLVIFVMISFLSIRIKQKRR